MRRLTLILIFITCLVANGQDYEGRRLQMVEQQLLGRDIKDRSTIEAMKKVPRHVFVPARARKLAYNDHPLDIGFDQTISQPYMVAFMTQDLKLVRDDRVLEIGTGSGYQAAVLAEIAAQVYSIEIVEELGLTAKKVIDSLGYNNISLRIGDGYNGWPEAAPFDAIIVTAGVEVIPQPLLDQLADGGRMIIPVGPRNSTRELILVKKKNGKLKKKSRMPVLFVEFTRKN